MKVAVIGSRGLTAPRLDAFLPGDTDEILTGGAAGVDASARAWAEEAGIPCREFLPDYERFGRSAPIRRNAEMLSEADLVLAFWDGKSPGTRFGIEYCKKHGVPIRLFVARVRTVRPLVPKFRPPAAPEENQ